MISSNGIFSRTENFPMSAFADVYAFERQNITKTQTFTRWCVQVCEFTTQIRAKTASDFHHKSQRDAVEGPECDETDQHPRAEAETNNRKRLAAVKGVHTAY